MGSLWSDQCSGVHWEEICSLGPKERTEQQMRFDSACCSHENRCPVVKISHRRVGELGVSPQHPSSRPVHVGV